MNWQLTSAAILAVFLAGRAQADEKDHPILKSVLAGRAPAAKDLKSRAIPAKVLSPQLPNFTLPALDKAKLVSLSDFKDSVVIVHLTASQSIRPVTTDVLKALRTRLGPGLNVLTVLLDEGTDPAKLSAILKERSVDWPVLLDDHGEFREIVLRENFYTPSFVVVGRDRRAQWISLDHLEDSLASMCRAVEEEIVRKPSKRPGGPVSYFCPAEAFTATPITGGRDGSLRFGAKPALLLSTQANDTGSHLEALNAIAKRFADRIDVLAVVAADSLEQAREFSKNKSFRVVQEQSALPSCYGPSNRYRLALISPAGRVVKVILLDPSYGQYLPIYERYATLLTTPGALLKEANEPVRTNLALQASGGHVESATSSTEGEATGLIDGKTGRPQWTVEGKGKPEIMLSFRNGQQAHFDRVWLDLQSPIQDLELAVGDDLKKPFRSLGTFRMEDRRSVQAVTFIAAKAKYLKVRLLSAYEPGASFALGEIGVEGVGAASPELIFTKGFRDEFAEGRLTFWQQEDVGNLSSRPAWRIEKGKLVQPQSPLIRGFDHRCTALLHAASVVGDFRLEATVTKPYGLNAGLVFGFRDWDNFDSLLLLEAQVLLGKREGNSIRLERRRDGKTQVLSIHGEWFDQSKPIKFEVTSRGTQLAVKANNRLIMSLHNQAPVAAGRVGLCTAGASNSSFESIRLTPLEGTLEPPAEMNPLSTAAGATIVWVSGQGNENEPLNWASHLLHDAALSSPGAWVVSAQDGKPPEIVLAFRDVREVTLEEVGFQLPQSGDSRQRAKKIEVQVASESPLRGDRFRSVGTFELENRPALQTFRLEKPEPARYVRIRILENHGASKFSLARVYAKISSIAKAAIASPKDRADVESTFATAAPMREKEPNHSAQQATQLLDDKELDAAIRPGEMDFFRLPDAPAKKGRACLHLQMTALPWLRLHGDLLDASETPLTPPLLRPQANHVLRHTHSSQPPPRFIRVEMPRASLSVVLDMSGSMSGREKDVSTVIKTFFEGVTPNEQVEVLSFASEVKQLAAFTSYRTKLEPIARGIHFGGATALYKGLLRALDDLEKRGGNRAILLLSDGMNTIPGEGFADLCRRLQTNTVPIYVVGVGQDLFEYDAASGNTCADLLRNLALVTGGRYFFAPTSSELGTLYRQIADELRGATRYRLLARWEISERIPELLVSEPRTPGALPFAGPLPPLPLDLDVTINARRPVPHSVGFPPAATEVATLALPEPSPRPHRLQLSEPCEIVIDAPPSGSPRPRRTALPAFWELDVPTLPGAAFRPARLVPLPEFGSIAVVYKAEGAGTTLPVTLRPALELILDSSGSMKEDVEGAPKYLAARRVMTNVLKALPDDATVGLRVFGHMRFWDPAKESMPDVSDTRYNSDSELVVPIGPLAKERRDRVQEWVNYLTPKGATPLVYSLVQASKDFPAAWKGPRTVILISDGVETCGGRLEDVETAYRNTDLNLIIHVVGFDVKEAKEQEYLKSLARIGRGQYFHAANSQQLTTALSSALGSLGYQVCDGAGRVVGVGTVNGSAIELPAGLYSLVLPGTSLKPLPIQLGGGKLSPVHLDGQGRLGVPRP